MSEALQSASGGVAVITGAGNGIGREIALGFARLGLRLVLGARSAETLDRVVDAIKTEGGEAIAVVTDVTSEADVAKLFQAAADTFGPVDILVNSAGIARGAPIAELSLETWKLVIDTNLTGAFLCCREAMRAMQLRGRGRIINIGSVSAKTPRANAAAYSSSKFALEGLTRSIAIDGRAFGISVSIIQPGNTETQFWNGREAQATQEGIMSAADVARVACLIVTLPSDVNLFESVIMPVRMPLLGRG